MTMVEKSDGGFTVDQSSILISWLRLIRAHTISASAAVVFIGYMSVAQIGLGMAIYLFILAAFIHTSGCALNDYYDYEYDKEETSKSDRPLVRGDISPISAKLVGYGLAILGLGFGALFGIEIFLFGIILAILGIYYNMNSKDNIISEFAFAGWETGLVVLGALMAGGWTNITTALVIFMFIQSMYQIQEGSMKDITGSERTLLSVIGVNVVEEKVHYPVGFKSTTYVLKGLQLCIIGFVLYYQLVLGFNSTFIYAIIGIAILANAIFFIKSTSMWLVEEFDRQAVIKGFTVHELTAAMMVLLSLYPSNPRAVLALVVFIPMWALITNIFIHSGPMMPDI